MKKLTASIIVALAFSAAAAVAQSGTDPSQGNPGASPSTSQPSTPSEPQTMPSQQQPAQIPADPATSPASQPTSSDTAAADKAEKKLRGCVQSQGGQYVLEDKKGKTIALTGQDVSAHVGHEVSLKGTWEGGNTATGVSTASGASADKTFNVASVDMISNTCSAKTSKGNSGSMGGSPSTSNPGAGSTSNPPQQ
jgi:hypothetical protein